MPSPTPACFPAATLASAVPRGEGEGCRSCFRAFSTDGADFRPRPCCGPGDPALRDVGGREDAGVDEGGEDAEPALEVVGAGGSATVSVEEGFIGDSDSDAEGVSNSTGLVRGVAWTLVMSFAREQ